MHDPAVQEPDRVVAWRTERFIAEHFTVSQASRLAEAGADWHEADRLLRLGCPIGLVYKLIKPLDPY